MKIYKNLYVLYGCLLLLLFSNVGVILYFTLHSSECPVCEEYQEITSINLEEEKKEEKQYISVDIKGYVKKPGVYQVEEGTIVNDVLKLAGGLKSSGTTDDINLSKKVLDGTVIVVKQKSALKSQTNTTSKITTDPVYEVPATDTSSSDEKVEDSATVENKKISLNQATKEELMTLSGIGEKTAEKIIEYRATQAFLTIEDIKNVSGIGESIFEKIKDFITI